MDRGEAIRRFSAARVARLATSGPDGPHLVPVVFAVTGDRIVTAVDHKPKRRTTLKRLQNIDADPRVALLVDRYDDDWDRLWWVRADGMARVTDAASAALELDALVRKYPQYRDRRPTGPTIVVEVTSWRSWEAQPGTAQ